MARKFKYCILCRRTITEVNLRRGLYVETADGMLCATCAQRLDEPTRPAEPPIAPKPAPVAPAPPEPRAAQPTTPKVAIERPKPMAVKGAEPMADLESIRQHVEAIRRILLFEKSSAWNVIGAVVQCMAVGMLIIAAFKWLDDPQNLLTVALILQVMALAAFVKAK